MKHLSLSIAILVGTISTILSGCEQGKVELGNDTSGVGGAGNDEGVGGTTGIAPDDFSAVGGSIGAGGATTSGTPVDVFEAYGFCSDNLRSGCSCPEIVPADSSGPAYAVNGGVDAFDGFCLRPCDVASDCPVPNTGTSKPECRAVTGHATCNYDPGTDCLLFDRCVLPCDNGQTCPDGMTCQDTTKTIGPGGALCVWHTSPAEDVARNPELCGELKTREACEAFLSDYPLHPDSHCAWATDLLIPRSDATCTTTTPVGRCVAVSLVDTISESTCGEASSCDGTTAAPVWWAELGAGDLSVIQLEACDHRPYAIGLTSDYASCDFSADPSTPSVCGCVCAK